MNAQNYVCLKKNRYVFQNYQLIPIRIQDIENIRQWRNEQINFLRQETPISTEEQEFYFKKNVFPLFNQNTPNLILFSFLKNSLLIGYGGFVNMHWKNKISEISFLIETKRSKDHSLYENDFSGFLCLLKEIACRELNFKQLFTETYDVRPNHIHILEKNEFKRSKKKNNVKIIDGKPVDVLFHSYMCDKDDSV